MISSRRSTDNYHDFLTSIYCFLSGKLSCFPPVDLMIRQILDLVSYHEIIMFPHVDLLIRSISDLVSYHEIIIFSSSRSTDKVDFRSRFLS